MDRNHEYSIGSTPPARGICVTRRVVLAGAGLAALVAVGGGSGMAAQEATPPIGTSTGAQFLVQFDAAAGKFSEGVTVAEDGTVYASLSLLGLLVQIEDDGDYEIVGQVEGLQEGDLGLLGITAHSDGNIYGGVISANPDAHGVWHFDVETGDGERVPGTEHIALPNAITFSADGSMYVTDTITGSVWLVPPDGTAEQWLQHEMLVGTESLGYPFPVGANGITIDEAGNSIYVAVLERGTLVTIPFEEDGSAGEPMIHTEFTGTDGLAMPDGIAMDAAGSIYVAQPAVSTVVRVTHDGDIETVATAADGLDGPTSLAIGRGEDAGDILYVANFSGALAPHVPAGGAGPGIVMIPLDQNVTLGPPEAGTPTG